MLRTGELQMRPVMMTCIIAGVGLLPAAMSSGIGSQVQKPLAVVVVGGMMLAPILDPGDPAGVDPAVLSRGRRWSGLDRS